MDPAGTDVRLLRVVIASPTDVQSEANALLKVVDDVNRTMAVDYGVRLEAANWRTDAYPGFHPDGPQGLIDPLLRITECDLLLAIFWTRFGTPTKQARSGTEHEIQQAYRAWKENGRPQVMVYFNQKSHTPKSKAETDQWGRVLRFREEFPKEGLYWDYRGLSQFKELAREHLISFIRSNYGLNRTRTASSTAAEAAEKSHEVKADYFAIQENLIREYNRTFVGRIYAHTALDQFMRAHDRGYFIVRAGPGQGKTALACSFVARLGAAHHFISRTGGRADPRLVLRSLIAQLPNTDPTAVESVSGLTKIFEEAVTRANRGGRPAVIVIDALDELPAESEDPPYLPTEALPEQVYVLVTGRPGDRLNSLVQRLFGVPYQVYDLGPLTFAEMHGILSPLKLAITDSEIEHIAGISQGNPLYIRAVADQLTKDPAYNLKDLPASIEGFFRKATEGLNTGNRLLADVLALLSVARMPLTIRELSALAGVPQRDVEERGIRPITAFLLEVDQRFTFYHARFHDFVTREMIYEDELRGAHARFVSWLGRPENRNSAYRLSSLAYHLFESGDREGLEQQINEAFVSEKVRRSGYAVLEDIELLTRSLLERNDPALIRRCIELVNSVRNAAGGDIIGELSRAIQPYRSGPAAFRTKLIEPVLPRIEGIQAYAAILPKAEVAADFFESVSRDGRWFVALGDAPAIGLKSAFAARFLGNVFQYMVTTGAACPTPAEIVRRLDELARGSEYFERITLQCIEVDIQSGVIHIANAGHPDPVHYVARRQKCDILPVRGDASLGATDRRVYDQDTVEVEPGDRFVLVTDGLTEDHVLGDDAYGYSFVSIIKDRAAEPAQAIGEAVIDNWRAHPREEDIGDDATLVVIAIEGLPAAMKDTGP